MIVCRRPWTIYDVDVIGLTSVACLVVAAVWLVVAPWQATWAEYCRLSQSQKAASRALLADMLELQRFEDGLSAAGGLEATVETVARRIPRTDSFSWLLRKLADIAKDCNLELLSVEPQPAGLSDGYLLTDVQIGGRGRVPDFIRFLDRLAQENPYQYLRSAAVSRPPAAVDPGPAICNINWTIRFYLMPTAASATDDGRLTLGDGPVPENAEPAPVNRRSAILSRQFSPEVRS